MPHDRNGKLVEVGDIVMGRGYNVKHDIIGPVLDVTAAGSCNLTVGIVKALPMTRAYGAKGLLFTTSYPADLNKFHLLVSDLEYGATKDFEVIQKADGTQPV
ncbi:MAG: hypothetical protein ABSF90_03600 [Syntrophobacteraceae bacterium]|jgi:5,10-methenyltetrahydromethanopterin hydrogenase